MPSNFQASDFLDGKLILIDKPLEWTSFDVVNKLRYSIRRAFDIKKIKVGHAGTLDPLATGLLIVCAGKATKQINEYMGQKKEYTGTITLGATTPSYDLETEVDQTFPTEHINEELIENARLGFIGTLQQIPPIFSAIKKDGQKAYNIARSGETIEMPSREVHIEEFEVSASPENSNLLHFRAVCSKGTYIRSLAYDMGKALQSGAHLSSLRRTKIGDFDVSDAMLPKDFVETLL